MPVCHCTAPINRYITLCATCSTVGANVPEDLIWQKLASFSAPLPKNNLTISPLLINERATPLATGAWAEGIRTHNVSLAELYQATCSGIIRNIATILPLETLLAQGVKEIICTGSIFNRHPYLVTSVQETFNGLSVSLGGECDAAYGAVIACIM